MPTIIAYTRRYTTIVFRWALAHKVWAGIITLVLLGGAYWEYGHLTFTSGQTLYVLGIVQKGTVISTVSASGQVSPSHQVDITPKASGEIVAVYAHDGQQVSAGQ